MKMTRQFGACALISARSSAPLEGGADPDAGADLFTEGLVPRDALLTAQITSYEDVAAKMRERMAALPEGEQTEWEQAAAILRRVRAGGDLKLLPLTIVSKDGT
ncbi:hypothetical protein ACH4LK_01555 [Streptomyces lydicus]|uniref:hypothetical protein n=1 Tax=Streptomyces lydicus TaxID=47763 RepID=UPI0037AE7AB3